ncbi:hypothetical protein GCM10023191_039430 [Actinoallomurus oryzae]|uniref:NlpC/P60 domain-containing protein n=1 Tax=Actinoallomurus oryzae TaxID=502180 RepID=A0ABP8Q2Y9_9ACTN
MSRRVSHASGRLSAGVRVLASAVRRLAVLLRPTPHTLLWPVVAAVACTLLTAGGPRSDVIQMVTPAKTPNRPASAHPATREPAELTKVRSALRAMRAVQRELAGVPGASSDVYDRATGELARLERTLTAQPAGPAEDVSQPAASADAVRARISRKVLAFARAQIGKPYIYGGVGPRGFDCSGLTMEAYRAAGIKIPRTSDVQYFHTHHIARGKERPGDLVFFNYHRGMTGPGHVGIVLDPARHTMIVAPHTGTTVKIQNYLAVGRVDGLVGFTRPGHGGAGKAPASPAPAGHPNSRDDRPKTVRGTAVTPIVTAARVTHTPTRTPHAHPHPAAERHPAKKTTTKKKTVLKAAVKRPAAQETVIRASRSAPLVSWPESSDRRGERTGENHAATRDAGCGAARHRSGADGRGVRLHGGVGQRATGAHATRHTDQRDGRHDAGE